MSRISITFRLFSFITVAFFITTLSVLFFATNQLNNIIDTSQNAVYSEKLEAILGTLDRIVRRLRLTENVEAYEDDFKKSALQTLSQIYYRSPRQTNCPVIFGADGRIMMQPKHTNGDTSIPTKKCIKKVLTLKNGNFRYAHEGRGEQWIIFRYFEEWKWAICYTLPLDAKYADARRFRNILISIMVVITLLVLSFLSVIITKFTKPIIKLTRISAEMAKGNLEIPISTRGKDEVSVLSRSFIHMRDSIREKLMELEKEISERKLSEKALKTSEERYRTLTNNLNVGVYRNAAGPEGKFIEANPAMVKLFGYENKEDLLQINAADLYENPDDRKNFNLKMIRDGAVLNDEEKLFRKDGTPFIASISAVAVKNEKGEVTYYDGIVDDITERKRIEEALRESEEKYRTVIESIEDGYFELDMAGSFTFFNGSMSEILRYPKDDLMGMNYRDYMDAHNAKKMYIAFTRINRTGIPTEALDWKLIRKDGSECFVQTVISLIKDSDGLPIGYRGIARDVTDLKLAEREKSQLEAKLQQAQKMKELGTLAGGIAHDFNNILMGIQGRTSLMILKTEASHSHFEHLKGIEEYIKSATDLTKQLLGFAREGKYEIRPTDLKKLITRENQMFGRTRKEIQIQEKFSQDLWTVEIDRGQIEQVLLNIYINAWQAMPDGGDLWIRADNTVIDESHGSTCQMADGKYVKISITDSGVGMDEKTRQRIFDPFFTTKGIGRGTGLGLASAYGIIKNHKGFIEVHSRKGEGTTFSIYLPASEKTAVIEEVIDEELIQGTETILLVDDEEIMIEVGQQIFESLGYQTLIAENGKEAIDICRRNLNRIDLVVLDMIMPDMGGRETYDKLKEIKPDIKVLLSSGYSIDGQAARILECGCNGFIQKPFNMTRLSKKIREILDHNN